MNIVNTISPTWEKFDNTVNKVLSKPGYKHLSGGFPDLINKIKEGLKEKIEAFLNAFFSNISDTPKVSEGLSNIFLIIGLLILIIIIIFIVVKINKIRDKKVKISEIFGEKLDEDTSPESLRVKAMEYNSRGEYREAIRYEFIALLLSMHEKGLLILDETKTGDELYQFLRKNGYGKISAFKVLVNIFNSSWYGRKKYDLELYKKWEYSFNLIWNEVTSNEEKA